MRLDALGTGDSLNRLDFEVVKLTKVNSFDKRYTVYFAHHRSLCFFKLR